MINLEAGFGDIKWHATSFYLDSHFNKYIQQRVSENNNFNLLWYPKFSNEIFLSADYIGQN